MTPSLTPTSSDRGLATSDAERVGRQTVQAWDDFLAALTSVDFDAPSRLRRTPARAIVAKVGDWPESRQLAEILDDAAAGRLGTIDQDAIDDAVVEANQQRPAAELVAAVGRSRDSLVDWLTGNLAGVQSLEDLALKSVGSPLGELPVITYIHAATFQLAVAARDLRKAGAVVPDRLPLAGLRALVDTTGALAARMGIDTAFAVVTPAASVLTVARHGGWIVQEVDPSEVHEELPGLEGDVGLVIDVAAGRKNPLGKMRKKELILHNLPSLMKLAPIAQENPGLPGGPILRKAAGVLSVFGK